MSIQHDFEEHIINHCALGCHVLFIGEAGAGKTSLVLHLARVMGGRVLYINTEGSLNDERVLQVFWETQADIRVAHVMSQEELLSALLEAWWSPSGFWADTIIVDSVNNLYRPQAWEGEYPLDLFNLINAVMYQIAREGGRVLSSAQVSMETGRPSGAPVLTRYKTLEVHLERLNGYLRRLAVLEDSLSCVFRIVERGVEWRGCARQ